MRISPRLTWRGGRTYVRRILSEPKFLECIDNQISLPMVLRFKWRRYDLNLRHYYIPSCLHLWIRNTVKIWWLHAGLTGGFSNRWKDFCLSSKVVEVTGAVLSSALPGILVGDFSWNFWLAPYSGHNFQNTFRLPKTDFEFQNRFWVWQKGFGFRT